MVHTLYSAVLKFSCPRSPMGRNLIDNKACTKFILTQTQLSNFSSKSPLHPLFLPLDPCWVHSPLHLSSKGPSQHDLDTLRPWRGSGSQAWKGSARPSLGYNPSLCQRGFCTFFNQVWNKHPKDKVTKCDKCCLLTLTPRVPLRKAETIESIISSYLEPNLKT